jgi:hypothetical protein
VARKVVVLIVVIAVVAALVALLAPDWSAAARHFLRNLARAL